MELVSARTAHDKQPLTKREFNEQADDIRQVLEAGDAARNAADAARNAVSRSWCVACAKVSDLLGRGIEGIEHPTAYLAKSLGVTGEHARRLRRFGDMLRIVSPLTPTHAGQWVGPVDPDTGTPVFHERQLRPLAGLLEHRDDLLPKAYLAALDAAGEEPLTNVHTAKAAEAVKADAGVATTPRNNGRRSGSGRWNGIGEYDQDAPVQPPPQLAPPDTTPPVPVSSVLDQVRTLLFQAAELLDDQPIGGQDTGQLRKHLQAARKELSRVVLASVAEPAAPRQGVFL